MSSDARRAVLRAPGVLEIEAAPPQCLPRGSIEVRVLATGVCRTDVHIASGADTIELPRVLGHEVAGWVEELGPAVLYGAFGCGACVDCRTGQEQMCPHAMFLGRTVDGGFADRVVVPGLRYCVPLGALDPVEAAPLADAGLTAYRAVRRSLPWLRSEGTALVIGAGGLGSFAVQLLRELTTAAIAIHEIHPGRRAAALELALGRASEWDGRAVDVVLDFVGSAATLHTAADAVRAGGTVVVVGNECEPGGLLAPLGPEVAVVHSIWGSLPELHAVVALARDGRLRLSSEAVPLESLGAAVARLRDGDVSDRLVVVP